jgi:hypothetical protein
VNSASPPAAPDPGRRSYALERFTTSLAPHPGLHLFDFGGANQANLDFLTAPGHRVYFEDLLLSVDYFFSPAERDTAPSADRIQRFLAAGYSFSDQSADGVLVWDTLQYIPTPLAEAFVQNLFRVLVPDACLLALFSPEGHAAPTPPLRCRILDPRSLSLEPRPTPRALSPFSNRAIERLFSRFSEVKFFLTRENIREVIVRR